MKYFHRSHKLSRLIAAHIEDSDKVIDIGSGGGSIDHFLVNEHGKNIVVSLDVVDNNRHSDLHFRLYEGKRIPYKGNQFDVALLVFVLHHADNPSRVLLEAARVAKDRIILVEDVPRNKLEHFLWEKIDNFLNHRKKLKYKINHHEAYSQESLDELISSSGLKIESSHSFRTYSPILWAYRHKIVVLSKS